MHGEYKKSTIQRLSLTTNHIMAILIAAWIIFGNEFDVRAFNDNYLRRIILISCSIIYFCRFVFTGFWFLKRKMGWEEVIPVSVLIYIVHICFAFWGSNNFNPLGSIEVIGVFLYIIGSYLNTVSEYQRFKWKSKPENKGKLYAKGLFKYSMHVNYFGDSLLFTGFALIVGNIWALIIPFLMAVSFLFYHIPTLDKYLEERYGEEFLAYESRTKKFFPYVY